MTLRNHERLRLRVDHLEELVIDLQREDHETAGVTRCEVRVVPSTAEDRAAGLYRYQTTIDGWVFDVTAESEPRARLRERAGQGRGPGTQAGSAQIRAQIPGRVVRLWVAEGDTVEAGQRLLAIEAMKMENEVRAPQAGVVASIGVAAGSSVELGDELLIVR